MSELVKTINIILVFVVFISPYASYADKNMPISLHSNYEKYGHLLYEIDNNFYFTDKEEKKIFFGLQKEWLNISKKTCSILYSDIGDHTSFLLYYKSCLAELLRKQNNFLQKNFLCKISEISSEQCIYVEFNATSITPQTLTQYNNIAYYLQQAGANEEAVYLLEKIIKKFPKRTVAYINLGDAYWELGEKTKARKAYSTYIEQMCAKGLQKKIPKKVIERVKSRK